MGATLGAVFFFLTVDDCFENDVLGVFLLPAAEGVRDGFGDAVLLFLEDAYTSSSVAASSSKAVGFLVLVFGLLPVRASSYS